MSTPGPRPRPGPIGPDIDALRSAFDDLLADSVVNGPGDADAGQSVRDEQVRALDSAHELLAEALTSLDNPR